jgi:serine/threonine protein kinase
VSTAILLGLALLAAIAVVVFWWRRRSIDPVMEVVANENGGRDGAAVELGPYKLVEKIGEGGMAEVYTAVSGRTQPGPLVVKCLRPALADDPLAVAHFVDEGRLSSSLVHPNIVRVYEDGVIDGRHYLVQEYVAGRDLGCLTRTMVAGKHRPLPAPVILYLAHELLLALEYAHDKRSAAGMPLGVVHCDVSPENVLISTAGEVKLLDFGIARSGLVGEDGSGIKGNVDFMAPEQARGEVVDPRSDLFSVGLVMYYCAARAPLYRTRKNSTVFDKLALAAAGPGEEEWAFVAGLPPPLADILPRVLEVDLGKRVQSARALRHAIAPHVTAGAPELAAILQKAFGDAIAAETRRLRAATPPRRRRTTGAVA